MLKYFLIQTNIKNNAIINYLYKIKISNDK